MPLATHKLHHRRHAFPHHFLRWPSVSHICALLQLMSSSVVHQTIPLTLIWKLRIPVSPDVAHLNQFVQGGFFEACQIMSTKKVMQCQKSCFLAATVIINAKTACELSITRNFE